MKKSLVLAMAMALGVTASAYAANPFSDVPAGHWAYDSVNKLAAAGVVEGYPDGTYGGDKLMTRYEMAQIVAKAMAKGANVDKLAAEFADELDSLGVRVAALEKKADNVKITGKIRAHYADMKDNSYTSKIRTDLTIKGQVNEDWSYTAMIRNEQNLGNNTGDETTNFQRAYVNGKIGGVKVQAGRYNYVLGEGNIYDNRMDGVVLSYGKNVKVEGYYAVPTATNSALSADKYVEATVKDKKKISYGDNYDEALGAKLSGQFDNLGLAVAYDKFKAGEGVTTVALPGLSKNTKAVEDNNIWSVAANYNFGAATLGAIYLNSDVEDKEGNDDGYVVSLNIKGAKASAPGSWGLYGKYYDQAAGTIVAHTTNGMMKAANGFKGYMAGVDYALAKNIVAAVEYYDYEDKVGNDDYQTLWSQVVFTF